jgi:hypothetical protein
MQIGFRYWLRATVQQQKISLKLLKTLSRWKDTQLILHHGRKQANMRLVFTSSCAFFRKACFVKAISILIKVNRLCMTLPYVTLC